MRRTIVPLRSIQFKPAFWGVDRDLREVMESMENVWEGGSEELLATNFQETEQAFFLSIDMPGVNKKNLEIHTEGDYLYLKGTRKSLLNNKENNEEANITKTVTIPKLTNKEKIQARCEDGVVYIALPKIEKAKPRKINVEDGLSDKGWDQLIESNK